MAKLFNILMVEDSPDDAELTAYHLKKNGIQCHWRRVQTAEQLREALQSEAWDIVLSDYSMPQFTGLEALQIVKEVSPELPCIIVSGVIGEETAVAALQAGARDFFVKGRLARLPSAIQRHVEEVENLRQRKLAEQKIKEIEKQRWLDHQEALKREQEARQRIEILYEEAQESNRLKEEFLATLSHELRTPMNAITGWSELLANGICDPSEYPMAFATIYQNAQAQNKLINDILDVSRIMTGKMKIERQCVSLEKVLKDAMESVRLSAQAKEIDVSLDIKPNIGNVAGDAHRLQEVAWNILANAVKFTPKGGHIKIELFKSEDSHAVLKVHDDGEGVDPAFMPYIFERFRQADGSMTRKHGGLGLGLALVRELVELHGGQVSAQSPGIGQGTTIVVKLPLMAEKSTQVLPAKKTIEAARLHPLEGAKILVVDDQRDILDLVDFILKKQGAYVLRANSAEEAFHIYEEEHPDILVCDIEMPGQNGYNLMRRIRLHEKEAGVKMPSAALTAHARQEDVMRAHEAGFNLHLAKPIDISTLISSIEGLAEKMGAHETDIAGGG